MDRHRGDRGGDGGGRHSRMPSRWSDGPPPGQNHRYPNHSRGGGGGGGDSFSGGRHHPYRGGPHDYPSGGGGGGPGFRSGPGGYGQMQMPMGGPRRGGGGGDGGYPGSGRGDSPDNIERSSFAKLFIGSVPRTATEEDIRPLFEEHGDVIEVALIKDKRTGQQQGCCFIKYATSEEADRAIRALHNQYTLPGGLGPIQVRYADGERERLGAVEYKLFVGSLNKQATEKEVEEVFSPYGRVEDVYIMRDDLKQSRGCGFVKFSNREMAASAINGLNGVYVMKGCDQPLTVRFADPKRPRPGESRGGPAFGGPGFGPRSQAPLGDRPMLNLGEPMGGRIQSNTWDQVIPQSRGPSNQVPAHGFGSQFASKGGGLTTSPGSGSLGAYGGPTNGSLPGLTATPSSTSQQGFNPSTAQVQPIGQQISPLQKPLLSPQHLPPTLQLQHHQQTPMSYSQTQTLQAPMQQPGQFQIPHSGGLPSFSEALSSQQLFGLGGQFPSSQPLMPSASAAALRTPLNLRQQGVSAGANQQMLPASTISQQLLQQPVQQSPTQLLLQQQAQASLSSFQSPQQAFQLQQQLQQMQPSSLSQQQSSQTKQQSPWTGMIPQSVSSTPATAPTAGVPSSMSATSTASTPVAAPSTCDWTEHTSPEGYKYYYNSVTKESKWEKPEELTLFEQQQKLQQQHHKLAVQQLQSQSQMQPHTQVQSAQQLSQMQQVQSQMQLRQQGQSQLLQPSLSFQSSGAINNQNIQDHSYAQLHAPSSVIDPVRVQQGLQAAQEWMWKNKPAGT